MSKKPYNESLALLALAGIQFTHILDFMIVMPLGPMLMRTFGINSTQFGLIVSAYTVSAAVSGIIGSVTADLFDRKKFLSFLYIGFTLGTLFCALAPNYHFLLAARLIAGFFGGILGGTIFTIITDLIPIERRGAAIGTVMSAFSVSSVVGVPLGLMLATKFNWHAPFYFLVALCILLQIFIHLNIPKIDDHIDEQTKLKLSQFTEIFKSKRNILAFLETFFLMLSGFIVIPYISPYFVSNVGVSEAELSYLYLAGGGTTFLTARLIGKLADRFGALKVLSILIFTAFIPIVLITNHGPSSIWIALLTSVPFFVFISGRMVPSMTLISQAPSAKNRGAFLSINSSIQSMGIGVASFLGGLILSEKESGALINFNINGLVACVFGFITFIMALLLYKELQKKS